MRILFAVLGYKPAWRVGGPAVSVPALAEALVHRGHEVTVFTTNSNLDEDLDVPTDRLLDVDGVRVRYFARQEPLKRWLPSVKYLSQSIGTLYTPEMPQALAEVAPRVDLMHTHIPFVYPTMATARAAFRYQRPLFYHQRGVLDPEHLRFRALKKRIYLSLIEKPILRRATTLIALTDAERSSYARLGIDTPCRVIPNGIAPPAALPPEEAAQALSDLRIESHHVVVLFMGRLHPVKGAERLLKAFARIAPLFPDARLVLAGPDEFGIQSGFRTLAGDAGLLNRVIFPGMVSGLRKSALLARADLFCLPSDAEGFSMAVLEAMAHSTAVLVSRGCHFPAVETEGAGLVTDATVDAVEEGLRSLLGCRDRLAELGRAGRRLVLRDYTWDRVAESMIEAYEEGLQRYGSRHNGLHRR
jgi:glycosyltransferase involved in cell wall biosynthesis